MQRVWFRNLAGTLSVLVFVLASAASSGGSGADEGCTAEEELLVGQWITEGDTTASSSYNIVTYSAGGSGSVEQHAGTAQQDSTFTWELTSTEDGTCDKIDVGGTEEYSKIHELTTTKLDIEATDGSYYGTRTKYDRVGGSGGDGDGDSDTCDDACTSNAQCGSGEYCAELSTGQKCAPSSCQTCFNADQSCSYYSDCSFDSCS